MTSVKKALENIQDKKGFNQDYKIKVKKYVLDSKYRLTECGRKHEEFNLEHVYIYSFYYFINTHVTQGGNIYPKPNFDILIHNYNNEEIELIANGWRVVGLKTYGEDFNYPQKQDFEFRLQDSNGNISRLFKNERMLGGYEEIFKDKIEFVIQTLLNASQYETVDEYVNYITN